MQRSQQNESEIEVQNTDSVDAAASALQDTKLDDDEEDALC